MDRRRSPPLSPVLVERAIVVRRVDGQDRRKVVVALSPRGHVLAVDLRAQELTVEHELTAVGGLERLLG